MLTAWVEYATQTFLSAPVAQLDRVAGSDPVGRGFESLQARHFFSSILLIFSHKVKDLILIYPEIYPNLK
tara:strand:- start:7922 stop:8131 length:210 start_codon:yes stop_codon:yes gene_type:complete